MLIFYTDIKSIPIDLYEAASLDGASPARHSSFPSAADYHANHSV